MAVKVGLELGLAVGSATITAERGGTGATIAVKFAVTNASCRKVTALFTFAATVTASKWVPITIVVTSTPPIRIRRRAVIKKKL
jgi:hypothetical protein